MRYGKLLAACVVASVTLGASPGFAQAFGPPPPPAMIAPQPAPGRGYAWVPGRYRWTGVAYVWVPGRWIARPPRYTHWVPGHWRLGRYGRWVWAEGHWA